MKISNNPIRDNSIAWDNLPDVPTKWYEVTKTRTVVSNIFLVLGTLALVAVFPIGFLGVSSTAVILAASSFGVIATALLSSAIFLRNMEISPLDPDFRKDQRKVVKNIVENKSAEATYNYLNEQEIKKIILKHEIGLILSYDIHKMNYRNFIKKHTKEVLDFLDQDSLQALKQKYIKQIVSDREMIETAASSFEAHFFGLTKEDLIPCFLTHELSRLTVSKEDYKSFKDHNGLELISIAKDKERELLVEKFQECVLADFKNNSDEMLEEKYAEDFKVFGEGVKADILNKVSVLRPKKVISENPSDKKDILFDKQRQPIRLDSKDGKVKLSQAQNFVKAIYARSLGRNVDFEKFNQAIDKFKTHPKFEVYIENAVERLAEGPLLKLVSISIVDLRGFDRHISKIMLLSAIQQLKLRKLGSEVEIADLEKKLILLNTKMISIPQSEVVRIGGGAVNSVYKAGDHGVFKPDETELNPVEQLQANLFSTALASGIPEGPNGHSAARSVATSIVDALLFSDEGRISVKTEYAILNGKRGILMEFAAGDHPKTEGKELRQIDLRSNPEAARLIEQKFRNKSTINAKDLNSIGLMYNCRNVSCRRSLEGNWEFKAEFVRFKNFDPNNATIAEDLLKTQLLDFITGQVDRHQKNYFIKPSGKLILIDNDCAFGIDAVPEKMDVRLQPTLKFIVPNKGSLMLRPPAVITQELKNNVDKLYTNRSVLKETLSSYISPAEVGATLRRLERLHLHLNSDKTLIVKDKEGLLTNAAKEMIDSNNSYWARELQVFDSTETNLNYLRKARP